MTSEHDNDSGLQVAMRMLLSIIAGLLLADILKLAVSSLLDEGKTFRLWASFLVVSAAALLFIARVVVDNVLYYNAPDAKLNEEAYFARVLLIVCDLVSYTLCYHIVNLLTAEASRNDLSATLLIRVIFDMAGVEFLHAAWCHLALVRLNIPVESPYHTKRRDWWRRWRATSGTFGAAAFIWAMVAFILPISTGCHIAVMAHVSFLLLFGIAGVCVYANVMRDQYSGDWKTPVAARDPR